MENRVIILLIATFLVVGALLFSFTQLPQQEQKSGLLDAIKKSQIEKTPIKEPIKEVPEVLPQEREPEEKEIETKPSAKEPEEKKTTPLGNCVDSDNGIDYETFGKVTYFGNDYEDRCLDSIRLFERYCMNDKMVAATTYCTYGCKDNACSLATAPPLRESCIDSDKGKDYFTFGSVQYKGKVEQDGCFGSKVREVYCNEETFTPATTTAACEHGCENGACKTKPAVTEKECLDSDGGLVYNVSGFVSYGTLTYNDFCESGAGEQRLKEASCSYGKPEYIGYNCPVKCRDGACVSG